MVGVADGRLSLSFHNFERDELPYSFQRHPGSEMSEVASMSMELLTAPYLGEAHGGYYSEEDARRAKRGIWRGTFDLPEDWRAIHRSDMTD